MPEIQAPTLLQLHHWFRGGYLDLLQHVPSGTLRVIVHAPRRKPETQNVKPQFYALEAKAQLYALNPNPRVEGPVVAESLWISPSWLELRWQGPIGLWLLRNLQGFCSQVQGV